MGDDLLAGDGGRNCSYCSQHGGNAIVDCKSVINCIALGNNVTGDGSDARGCDLFPAYDTRRTVA